MRTTTIVLSIVMSVSMAVSGCGVKTKADNTRAAGAMIDKPVYGVFVDEQSTLVEIKLDSLEIEEIFVDVGDYVEEGDVLVSFGSQAVTEQIKDLEESMELMEQALQEQEIQGQLNILSHELLQEAYQASQSQYNQKQLERSHKSMELHERQKERQQKEYEDMRMQLETLAPLADGFRAPQSGYITELLIYQDSRDGMYKICRIADTGSIRMHTTLYDSYGFLDGQEVTLQIRGKDYAAHVYHTSDNALLSFELDESLMFELGLYTSFRAQIKAEQK